MSEPASPLPNTPETDGSAGGEVLARAWIERQLAMLDRLAEAGLEAALAIERQAKEAGPDVDLNRISMAYDRVSRAVRMTIALQSKLVEDVKAREAAAAEKRAEAEDDDAWPDEEERRKAGISRIVGRVIEAERQDDREIDRLVLRAEMRLDDETLFDDILSRPIGEIVAAICRDLGLSPDWTRLAEEAWAKAEIAEGPEGSPFAGRIPLPLDGGEVRRGGDGSAAVRRRGHPHAQPFEGRESPHAASP